MSVELIAVAGMPEVRPGDDIATLISVATDVRRGDVLVVTQKIVSKAENRLVAVDPDDPLSHKALVEEESVRVLRRRGDLMISETKHGFVCANAGVDASNVPDGYVVLLPRDPDRSARHIQAALARVAAGRVGVVVADTHGRAFRRGIVNVAIGVAGFRGVVDHRGRYDREGRVMVATEQALADEFAAAAGILMDKARGFPAILVSDVETEWAVGGAGELLRDPAHDLFRGGGDPEEGM